MGISPVPLDPVELIRQLDPEQLRKRLEALDAERAALLKLLRAANAARCDRRPRRAGRKAVADAR